MKTVKLTVMKTLKKSILPVFLVMSLMIAIVGCSSSSNGNANQANSETGNNTATGAGTAEAITLEFQQWWGVELPDGVLQEIVDGFTDQTGIKIKLLSNPYADTKTQIAAGAAVGTMADVVGLDGSWVYDFAKQGSIANMTALMQADGYDDSQLSDQIKVDGNTYMIPVVNFAYPMYVNLDIVHDAGIEIPNSWSKFTEVSKKITTSTGKAAWAIPLSTESPSGIQNNFMSWLWASGGSMLKDGKPALTNNADLTATVEFVKGLFDAGVVAKGAYAMKEADMVEEFTNGRVAFMTDSLAHLTTIRKEAPDLNFDIIPVPVKDGYTGKSGMGVANWGIGIAENTKYKAEAMKFIEYLMSPEVNAKLAVYANAFPGNVNAEPDYLQADPLFLKAYEIYQNGYAINEFTGLPTSEELMRSFDEQLQLYLDGDTSSSADMLAETQKIWEEAFN
ncbi:sugar ABC transporter substrate-binding protein [Paenibacillus woosongensis]|uniref:Sugar ABC transporter substrate-binding protein n=1 Tax=Paenibacillus woosongensis TaxID=307580 RepID=A0AA95IAE7_9BACL|nr:sugar ABC transporter substrate-binding protein [Paenibacillus woosongensis]WHX49412.1 sugar ABC transporter substrate-binding protein [Paenibacillus woosongensis]